MATLTRKQITEIDGPLADRADFKGNSMSAQWCYKLPYDAPSPGRLDYEEVLSYRAAILTAESLGLGLYVVMSYSTPIAWAIGNRPAHIVEQKFSSTTSRHQSAVRLRIDAEAS